MRYSEVKKMVLRTLAVALVLVMPWAGALAADVASWSELQQLLGGWGGSVTLTADIVAEGTINVSEWDSKTVVLNGFALTPPSGSASVFSLAGSNANLVYVVADETEFIHAAADPGSTKIQLAGNITLNSPVVLANAQAIEQSGGTLTLAEGVTLSAEASTYAGLKAALANASVTTVKLSGDIQVTENCTIDLADVDLNGHTVAPQNNQQITLIVYNEAELTAALDMPVTSIKLGSSITLSSDLTSSRAHVIDLNGNTLTGNVIAQVASYSDLKTALNSAVVDSVQLTGDVTVNEMATIDLSKIDLNGNAITLQNNDVTVLVSSEDELRQALAMGAKSVKLTQSITLTSELVSDRAGSIDLNGYTLTGADIVAEVDTFEELKNALAISSVTTVKLTGNITVTDNDFTFDMSKVDLNGNTIAPQDSNRKITVQVSNEAQLKAALDMNVASIELKNDITITSDIESDKVALINTNGYSITGAEIVAEVDTFDELKNALANGSITTVKLTGNITVTDYDFTFDMDKVDLNGNTIAPQDNNRKITVQVSNEAQLKAALDMNVASIELKNDITITSDIESDKVALINTKGYSITGAAIIAEVDTVDELNAALANSNVTGVKLTGSIQVDNGFTLTNLSKIDFNGYSITPRQNDWTFNVAVTNEAELNQVLAMNNAVAVLQNNIRLSGDLETDNFSRINTNSYSFTGGQLIALVDTYNEFKTAMNSDAVDVVRLTKNIEANGWDTYADIFKMDVNGYALTGSAQLTFNVSNQEELALALAQPATNKAVLQNNIRLTEKVEVANLGKIDLNSKNLTRTADGGLVVGVTQEYDITNALALDYVYGVKLMRDITLTNQVNVDSLDQIDENGYTLSFSGNGKVALNVSNEQELRAALADPNVKYVNMTNDIRLTQDLTIGGGNSAQVITNGYKLTGAKVICNADSWEALKAACALGLPGAEITLTADITAGEGSLNITSDTIIDLHNYNIITGSETIFNVQSGKLTVKDTSRNPYGNWRWPNMYYQDDDTFCKKASINNDGYGHARQLTYYVTHSDIVASGSYANAGTQETRQQYNVALDSVGLIDARKSESPIFNIGQNGELEITGGAYFGSQNRAIYSSGDVTLSGDTVFANNSSGNGGAVYMNGGTLVIKERRQGSGYWDYGEAHGVVFTGNHASEGSSGGAIFVGEWAEMEMNGGYVTNNWCDEAAGDAGWSGGGGIAVLGDLTLNNGFVTANKAIGGGGIKTIINGGWDDGGALLMNGGIVAGNLATKYEGGGIVINHSGYGKITGGYITNNETATEEHWGGGGIFISDYGYMDMEAVFVVHNEAGGYGGGIAGCSTGRIDTHDTSDNLAHSTAIFENKAAGENMSGAGSTKDIDRIYAFTDPVFNRDGGAHYQDYFCALSSYICGGMLGNGTADWSGTIDGEPVHQGTVKKNDTIIGVSITGLTSHPTQTDKNNALKAGKVFVSGNYSYTHGGGILCDGYLVIGHEHHATIGDRMSVAGWKEAEGFNLKADEFGFYLVQDLNGNREPDELYFTDQDAEKYGRPFLTTATNDADGLVEFAHRIPFAEEGKFYYLIGEMKGNAEGIVYDDTIYLITVTVERDVLTVVETPDGGKHDIIAEPKTVAFYRIDKVELAKKEAGASSFGESRTVFDEESGANSSVDLGNLFTFVNTKTKVEYVNIKVTKQWVDGDNQDGIRPEEIKVQLLADGEVVEGKTATLTGTGNAWTYTFENLPKHVAGTQTPITYTVQELGEIVGYTTAYSEDTLTITNTHTTEVTEITVTKKWVDGDNQDGLRPEKITVQLLADGVEVEGKTADLTGEGNDWTYTFTELPKKANGVDIVYTVKELGEIVGYTTAYSDDTLTITNTHTTEVTEITVTKKWVDSDNQDGLRPEKITVQLLANGVVVEGKTAELTGEGNEWTYTFENLPKKADGKDIVYTVKEIGEIVGYTTAYSEDTLTITNTHETDETQITVTKKWVDGDNQDGLRPEKITIQLLADGIEVEGKTAELTGEGNEWTYTFENLPKKADGKDIVYTVKELDEIVGYTTAYSEDTLTITNTHETDETQITVTKKWVDNDNQDGLRPDSITVQLLANGEAKGEPVVLTGEGNEWTYTFENLPKKADGKDIVYTVKELGEIVGYTTAYSADTLTITNTHTTEVTEIAVTKKWVDGDNQDGLRPEKITVQLLADGVEVEGKTAELTGEGNEWTYTFTNLPKKANGVDIVYTVQEIGEVVGYTTAYSEDTLTITNTHTTEVTEITVTKKWVDNGDQDGLRPEKITVQLLADGVEVEGKTAELTGEGNEWTYTFENLPKKADGKDIVYTVKEIGEVVGYTTAYSEDTLTITNTHEADETQITVTKKWVDGDNQDGLRPDSITVQLLANGEAKGEPVVLTGEGNEWTYTFENLPKKADGKDIAYTVKELGEIVGYTTAYSADTLTITNTHETDETQITVTKKWVDNGDQDGLRPEKITVQLLADGVEVEGKTAELTGEGNEWTYTFENLPKKANGVDIVYTVKELGEIVGYTTAYSEDTLTITNTHETDETQITVTKKWVDNGDQDGLRPEKITVQLLADGVEVEGKTAELTGEGNEWTYTFENLPKKADGKDIVYTVKELGEIVGYTTAYSDDTLTITNTHETDETQITVTKKWVDNGDQDGLRPEKITVQLLADGVEVEGKTAELTGEGNEWTYTFENLPKKADGKDIVYTVKEIGEVVGYTTAYSEDTLTITNTHETDETQITVTKKWVDNGDQDGLRPEKITVQLLADGVEVEGKTAELTGAGNEWTYTFENLPKKADGKDIVYTVKEIGEIVGYTTAYSADTLTITNTHETENVSLSVEKVWDDSDNIAGLRSKSITVQLMADGQPVAGQTITLSKDNSWKGGWTDLDKFAAGKTIAYSVEEVTVPDGYTSKVEMIEIIPGHFQVKITNTYSVDKTQITVTKKWVDGNNYDGIRPRSITVQLVADGVPVEGKTAVMTGVGNEWTLTFSDLPKYAEGKEGQLIQYTVKELGEIVGYTTAYSDDTLTITNTHELFKRYSLEVEKVDAANPDKKLAGAKFTVYADEACTEELGVITTGTDGKGKLGNLLAGTYYLVETTVPAGYQLDPTVHAVVLGEDDAQTVTVKLVNHALIGSLTLKKTVVGSTSSDWSFDFDIELTIDTGDKLAGAYNATLNGMATTVVFTETDNGAKATVTLKDGDTLTILGLRTGTEYTVTEQPDEFFTTTVDGQATNKASGEIAENTVSVVAFQNKLELTDFAVKKEWNGLEAGENTPEISLILYCNGEVYTTVTPKPTVGGLYIYENLPTMVNGVKAVYTVVEQPVDGFTTTYINAGDNEAEVDCAYDGGTIINSKIPQTGDHAHVLLWMGMLMLAAIGLMGVMARVRRSEL